MPGTLKCLLKYALLPCCGGGACMYHESKEWCRSGVWLLVGSPWWWGWGGGTRQSVTQERPAGGWWCPANRQVATTEKLKVSRTMWWLSMDQFLYVKRSHTQVSALHTLISSPVAISKWQWEEDWEVWKLLVTSWLTGSPSQGPPCSVQKGRGCQRWLCNMNAWHTPPKTGLYSELNAGEQTPGDEKMPFKDNIRINLKKIHMNTTKGSPTFNF